MAWYLAVFASLTSYLTVTNSLIVVRAENISGLAGIQYAVTGELLKAGGASLIATAIIVEVARVVIGAILSARRIQRAEEALQKRWADWNRRRLETEAKGLPFDEPPPELETKN